MESAPTVGSVPEVPNPESVFSSQARRASSAIVFLLVMYADSSELRPVAARTSEDEGHVASIGAYVDADRGDTRAETVLAMEMMAKTDAARSMVARGERRTV